MALLAGATAPSAEAANKTFTGPGNFSDGARWSGGSLPAANDTLRINGICTNDNAAANLAYGTLEVGRSTAGALVWPVGGTNTLRVTGIVASSSGGTIDMSNGGALSIGANNWVTTGQAFIPGAGTIIWADTGAASTFPAAITSYNHLTVATATRTATLAAGITVQGDLTLASGTLAASTFPVTVKGHWFAGGGTFTPNSGSVTFSGTAPQTIGGFSATSFNNLAISNVSATVTGATNFNVSGTMTVAAGAVFSPAAAVVVNASAAGTLTGAGTIQVTRTATTNDLVSQYKFTTRTLAGMTVDYAGGGAQTVNNTLGAYHALTLSGSGAKTLQGPVTNNGALTIGPSATLADGGFTLTAKGSVSNAGTHSGAGKLLLAGAASQELSGRGAYGNLEMNNALGVSLSDSPTVNGTLTLTAGEIVTGTNQLNLSATASAIHVAGWVNGNLQKSFTTGSGQSFIFPIGGATFYRPAALSNLNVTAAGKLSASVTSAMGNHPQIATSGLNPSRTVQRWWTLAAGGGLAVGNYDATFTFSSTDVSSGSDTSHFDVRKWDGSVWSDTEDGVPPTATSATATGLSSFSDFVIGEPQASLMLVTLPGQTFTSGAGNSGTVSTQAAGTPFPLTLTAVGIFTNVDTSYEGLRTISYSGPGVSPGGNAPVYTKDVAFTNGQATLIYATLTKAETVAITATDNSLTGLASSPVTVLAGAVNGAQSTASATPEAVSADGVSAATITVILKDAYGNPVAGKTVALAKTAGAGSPAIAALQGTTDASGAAIFAVKSTTAAANAFTATDTSDNVTVTQTATVTFLPGALDHFAISPVSSPQTAGTPIAGVTITAQDINNNTVATFDNAVVFGGTAGVTGSSGAFTAGVLSGASITPTVAGYNLTVTVTALAKTGSTAIATVNPGALAHYHVTFSASPYYALTPFTTYVSAHDAYDNLVASDNGTPFVLSSSSSNTVWDGDGEGVFGTAPEDTQTVTTNGVARIATKCLSEAGIKGLVLTASNTVTHLTYSSAPIDIDIIADAYRTKASGTWSDASIWERYDGTNWIDATESPTYANGVLAVLPTHTVSVAADVTVGQLHIEEGGQLAVLSGATMTVTNAMLPGLEIYGTLSNTGTLNVAEGSAVMVVYDTGVLGNAGTVNSSSNSLIFYGGTYRHLYTTAAGTIPYATWEASSRNSTCAVVGYTSNTSTPAGLDQAFMDVVWDCPGQTGAISLGGGFTRAFSLDVHNTGTNGAVSLGADLTVTQAVVDTGAALHCGTHVVSGGAFTLETGGTLGIGSPDGIAASGASGNIQTANRSFGIDACYDYEGSAAQVTGSGIPDGGVDELSILNSAGVTLSKSFTVHGIMLLGSGALSIGANTLTIDNDIRTVDGSLTGGVTSSIVIMHLGGFETNSMLPAVAGGLKSLKIDRPKGIALSGPVTVWETLTLAEGVLSGGNYLTLAGGCTVVRSTGAIQGTPTPGGLLNVTFLSGDLTPGAGLPAAVGNIISNVTLANTSGTINMGFDVKVRGDLTVVSGAALNDNGYALTVYGNIANSGAYVSGGGRLVLAGGSAQHVISGGGTYDNLELNDPLGATLDAPVTVQARLTLTAGALANSGNLTLGSGALILRAAGALDATPAFGGPVSVTYFGTNSVTAGYELPSGASVLQNLTLAHTAAATLTLNADRTANNTLTIGALSTLADGGHTLTVVGDVYNNGTHGGAGKIALDNPYAQALFGSGTYGNLELVQGDVDLAGDPTISGTLTTVSGKFRVKNHTMTLNGPTVQGASTNLETTLASSLVFGGSATNVVIPASVQDLNNLTINNACGVTMASSIRAIGTLALTSGTLNTGTNIFHLNNADNQSVTREGGWINGALCKYFAAGDGQAFTYWIGDAAACRPIGCANLSILQDGEMRLQLMPGAHPQLATGGLNPAKTLPYYIRRTSLGRLTIGGLTATVHFSQEDVSAIGGDPTWFVDRLWSGDDSSWRNMTVIGRTSTSITVVGAARQPLSDVESYTDFAIGEPLASRLVTTLPGETFTSAGGNAGAAASQTVGAPFNLTLTAVDLFNAVDPTYGGARTISYSGPANAISGDTPDYTASVTFTNGQAVGVATTLKKAETTSITATDGTLTGVPSSALAVSGAATAAKLVFTSGAVTVNTGVSSDPVTVQRQDAYGNPVTGGTITLTLSSDSAGTAAFTPADPQIADGASSATFTFTDTQAGSPTLTASCGSLTPATQQETVVSPASLAWAGGGADSNWLTPGNWPDSHVPRAGDKLVFGGSAGLAANNNFASLTIFNGLFFQSGAGSFVLQGNAIGLQGDITNRATATQTIELGIELLSDCAIDVVTNGTLVIDGVLDGIYGLSKTSGGTLILTAANTYAGDTVINGGTLRVNNASGSGTGSGTVTVNGGATLGGDGMIAGSVSVGAGGTLAPGNSPGTIYIAGDLTLTAGSTFAVEIDGAVSDETSVGGTADISGATLSITALSAPTASSYTLIEASSITGTFSGLSESAAVTIGSSTYYIHYGANTVSLESQPLSAEIDIQVYATKGGVTLELWTVDESGHDDIVICAWISGAWVEVGRVPAENIVGIGSNLYTVQASGLAPDGAYLFMVIDEAGRVHVTSQPVDVKSIRADLVRLDVQTLVLSFTTEPGSTYAVEASTDLARWSREAVSYPTEAGWSALKSTPFTAGPGKTTEVHVPVNGRKRAYFKLVRIE